MNDLDLGLPQMGEDEVRALGLQYDTLTTEAQAAVRAEFARRGMEPPLVEDDVETMEAQGVSTIRQYRDQAEALMARSVLESAGIASYLRDENTIRIDWLWSNLMGGIRLQVADRDVEAAEAILTQPIPVSIAVPGEPAYEQPHCPKCGSLDTRFVSLDTKVAATSILLLGFPLPGPEEKDARHCNACGCDWTDDADAGIGDIARFAGTHMPLASVLTVCSALKRLRLLQP